MRLRLNMVGGVSDYPIHLDKRDRRRRRIWESRVAGYLSDCAMLLRAGYIVMLEPSEFGVPIGHHPDDLAADEDDE